MLHCQHTLVSSLPVGLHELSQLEELRASHCRLQTIDGRIGLLPCVRVLDCTSNPIWSPPADALSLDTPSLMHVLAALALSQPSHAVSSHIMCVAAHVQHQILTVTPAFQVSKQKVPAVVRVVGRCRRANGGQGQGRRHGAGGGALSSLVIWLLIGGHHSRSGVQRCQCSRFEVAAGSHFAR